MASSGVLVFRVGRDLGVHIDTDGEVYGAVLLGATEHRLDVDRYRTWRACGTSILPSPEAAALERFEDASFVDSAAQHLARLQEDKLVRMVEPDLLDSLLAFAADVRLCQVMPFQEVEHRVSAAQQPLGAGGRILAAAGPQIYPMIATAHRSANLARAVEEAAAQDRAVGSNDLLLTEPQLRLGDLVRTALGDLLEQSVAALEPAGDENA